MTQPILIKFDHKIQKFLPNYSTVLLIAALNQVEKLIPPKPLKSRSYQFDKIFLSSSVIRLCLDPLVQARRCDKIMKLLGPMDNHNA
jgi:hypothetical protein